MGWGGDGGGNSDLACCSVFLMILRMCLYMVQNSSGVSTALVSLFWICGSVVIPYMYSLSMYFWNFVFALPVWLAYVWVGLPCLL